MKLMYVLALFVSAASLDDAIAQAPQPSTCGYVYSNAVRDIEDVRRASSTKKYLFDRHCEKNGQRKNTDISADLVSLSNLGYFDFSGTKQEAESKMQQFCKIFVQQDLTKSEESSYKDTVVVSALHALNSCIDIENNNVKFIPSIAEPNAVSVTVSFNPAKTKLTIKSVQQHNMECKVSGYSKDGALTQASMIQREFEAKDIFVISCLRQGSPSPTGRIYERASLQVNTQWGPYSISLPPETVLNFDLASSAKARNADLAAQVQTLGSERASLQGQVTSLTNRINGTSVEVHWHHRDSDAGNCHIPGPTHTPEQLCGSRRNTGWLHAFSRAGHQCGHNVWVLACINQ
jgi:hypothetical protein